MSPQYPLAAYKISDDPILQLVNVTVKDEAEGATVGTWWVQIVEPPKLAMSGANGLTRKLTRFEKTVSRFRTFSRNNDASPIDPPKNILMPENEKTQRLTFQTSCDLIEQELAKASEDLADIRNNESNKIAAKNRCVLLRAALANARYYLLEFEKSLLG